ncbi:MAG: glycosyltransferase [Candidatus Caenarcaniphilales bacterium]|nr:glycosyltransferase [Candidatus Caenarcaniphilales bacterium]
MGSIKLSIIICTFNRALQLEQLLDDITTQHRRLRSDDACQVELILVDNNSFDESKEMIHRFIESTSMSIKYFVETRLGLTWCRNLAVTKASGDLLAFLHDDISLDDDWLKECYKIASTCKDQEIGIYGGRVIPLWQDSIPDWLCLEAPFNVRQDVFHAHSYGDEEKLYPFESEFGYSQLPSGINVLIRKEVFENCGNFRSDLGPSASGGFGLCDDYEFFEYLSMLKIPMLYIPQSIVFHPVSPNQMSIQYIRRWYFKYGMARFWIAHTDRMKRPVKEFLGIEDKYRYFLPQFLKNTISSIPMYLMFKFSMLCLWWTVLNFSFNTRRKNFISYKISETMGEIDAAALVHERVTSRKFSFKDRLTKKGILDT